MKEKGGGFEHKYVFDFMMHSVVNNVQRHSMTLAENKSRLGLDQIDEDDDDLSSISEEDPDESKSIEKSPM